MEKQIQLNDDAGNRFFSIRPEYDEPPHGRRVYAAIEVPEPDDNPLGETHDEPVYFECIDASWSDDIQKNRPDTEWVDIFQHAVLSVLEFNHFSFQSIPQEFQPGEIVWFVFVYSSSIGGEADATFYTNLYSLGTPVKIESQEPLAPGWAGEGPFGKGGWLTNRIPSLLSKRNPDDLVHAFLKHVDSNGGVAVYDVGQGACQGILEDNLGIPTLYVDFGGGVLQNSKTFPSEYKGFCFSEKPGILLSHWDWDHWSSAYRFRQALDVTWIAPPVPKKPIQQAFAADLFLRNNLIVWDSSFPGSIRVGGVQVERCTGRTTNDAGLAVIVFKNARQRKNCLLPGDASYRFVPSVAAGTSFSSLCVSHHGGRLHSSIIPRPKRGGQAVCSVGAGNSYHHPFIETFHAHIAQGWPVPLTTGLTGIRPSHVLLPWSGKAQLFIGGCHGMGACSVAFI